MSQGTHPEPVDTSALGWVMDGSDVVPPEFGYFLARTWRMHPEVAAPVSTLSYRGELASHPATARRALVGVQPGLLARPVRHTGNATQSAEEAAAVVDIVRDLLGASGPASASATPANPNLSGPARSHRPTSSW